MPQAQSRYARRGRENQLYQSLANVAPCLIGMEAFAGSHHLGRKLEKLGHQVRLLSAQYAKPYLKGHKNDFRDAEVIAEAEPVMPSTRAATLQLGLVWYRNKSRPAIEPFPLAS
jgi:transposase